MIRALIVDDEPLARATLRMLLADEPTIELIGECADGNSAIAAIARAKPDLVFLDVRMPGASGFDVLAAAGHEGMHVVFVTAFDQYAIDAFRADALDYLLKPFDDLRFRQTMERVRQRVDERDFASLGRALHDDKRDYLRRVLIRSRGRVHVLPVERIGWMESADNYVQLHAGGREYLLRQTLRDFERQLDPALFVRTHRTAIVNLNRIRELRPRSHGEAVAHLDDGSEVPVSRTRRALLEGRLSRLIPPAR